MNFGFKSVSKLPDFPGHSFGQARADRQSVGQLKQISLSLSLYLLDCGTKPSRIAGQRNRVAIDIGIGRNSK